MEQQACDVPGPHFKLHAPGDSFSFVHPMMNLKVDVLENEEGPALGGAMLAAVGTSEYQPYHP